MNHSQHADEEYEGQPVRSLRVYSDDALSDIEDLGLFIDGVPYSAPEPLSRRTKLRLVLAVLAVALLVATGVLLTQAINGNNNPRMPLLPALAGTPVPEGAAAISPQNAKHLVEFARWGRGAASQVIFSPDGKTLAIASSIGIYLYDYAPTGKVLTSQRFIETSAWVWSIAFTPDNQLLAAGLTSGEIRLWRMSDRTLIKVISAHSAQVNSVTFAPDGKTFASGSADGSAKLWSTLTGELVRTVRSDTSGGNWIYGVTFAPNGDALAVTGSGGNIEIWNLDSGELDTTLNSREGAIGGLAFSRDGRTLAAAPYGSGVQLWDMSNMKLSGALDSMRSGSGSMALSGDGQLVAAASASDDTITVWRGLNSTPIKELQVSEIGYSGLKSLTFSPDGSVLALVSRDGTIKLWRVVDWARIYALDGDGYQGEKLAYSPDSEMIASATEGGKIQLWSASNGEPLRVLGGADHVPEYLTFSLDGRLITEVLYTPQGSSTWSWRVNDGTLFRRYDITDESLVLMAISPDGQAFATQARGGTVKVWKIEDGTRLGVIDLK